MNNRLLELIDKHNIKDSSIFINPYDDSINGIYLSFKTIKRIFCVSSIQELFATRKVEINFYNYTVKNKKIVINLFIY